MFTSPWTPGWLPHLDCGPLWQFLPPLQAGRLQVSWIFLIKHKNLHKGYLNHIESKKIYIQTLFQWPRMCRRQTQPRRITCRLQQNCPWGINDIVNRLDKFQFHYLWKWCPSWNCCKYAFCSQSMVRFNLDLAYLNLIFLFIHLLIINHFLWFSLTGLSRILGGRAGARWVSSFVCFQSLTIQIIDTLISFSCKTFLFCEEPVYIHEIGISWEKM